MSEEILVITILLRLNKSNIDNEPISGDLNLNTAPCERG